MMDPTGAAGGRMVDWGAALETIRDPKTSEADAKALLQKLAADLFSGLGGDTSGLNTGNPDGGPQLPKGGAGTPDLGRLTSLLGVSQTGAASVQNIAQLVMELNLESRKAERQERQNLRDLDVQTQLQAADKIRSQAAFAFAATMISSAMSIAGGVTGIKGAMKAQSIRNEGFAQAKLMETPKLPSSSTTPATPGTTPGTTPGLASARSPIIGTQRATAATAPEPEAAPAPKPADGLTPREIRENAMAEAADVGKIWSDRAQIITESGKVMGAGLNFGAAWMESQKAELDAKATAVRSKAEDSTDFIRAYEENIRNVLSKLDAIQQSEAEMNRQIVRA